MLRHSRQAYRQLFLGVSVALTTIPGLLGCSHPTNSESQPRTSSVSGNALPLGPDATPVSPLPLTAQPSPLDAKLQQKLQGNNGVSPTQAGTQPPTNPSPNAQNTIQLPPHLAKGNTPALDIPKVPAQPNGSTVPKPAAIDAQSAAQPNRPAANIPPARRDPSVASPDSSTDSSALLTEEAKSIQKLNQPLDPNLRLTPPSSSPSPRENTSSGVITSVPGTGRQNTSTTLRSSTAPNPSPNVNAPTFPSSAGTSGTSSSSPRSNSSGLRQLEYKYNPSTGTYSTGTTE